jgi:hypothetical protein
MSKYDRLGAYLRGQDKQLVPMTFAEIERVVGTKLPKSQKHQAWWSNSTSNNVMTQVWLDAGYQTEQVDVPGRKLVFRRVRHATDGMREEPRMFNIEARPTTKVARHPAIGAMKGTFTIEPGYELTRPALDPDEISEWEANLDRMADELEARMSPKK